MSKRDQTVAHAIDLQVKDCNVRKPGGGTHETPGRTAVDTLPHRDIRADVNDIGHKRIKNHPIVRDIDGRANVKPGRGRGKRVRSEEEMAGKARRRLVKA